MQKKIILIAGISGIGKSTLCKSISELFPDDVLHLKASEFARNNGGVDFDQLSIVLAIKSIIDDSSKSIFLIDGHLTFSNFCIPLDALNILELDSIFVLEESPEVILERRFIDQSRQRKSQTLYEIKKSQERELLYADFVEKELNVPVHKIESPTPLKAKNILESYIA